MAPLASIYNNLLIIFYDNSIFLDNKQYASPIEIMINTCRYMYLLFTHMANGKTGFSKKKFKDPSLI